ncbi:Zn(II)2Cys6 transcription factor [Aspergillus bertholletiae]|uniref:Zn(II)2Cys6 transcription factor n=1 Tax=Aspergillus bertholletiae TaxID=1226010 RepID=A0A5N7BJN3_9EURO|nr:Zn(II)2Cys6 transcription factor [Aspergillus bertholletiae]
MVYRGKPSPACEPCRTRRLKCDQQRPSCSQCVRAHRECSGYRDVAALSFHNQSDEVIGKVRRQQIDRASSKALSRSRQPSPTTANGHRQSSSSPTILPTLTFSVNDQASGFIFAHYVRNAKHTRGHLDFLPTLMRTDTSPAVTASISALGLASLANIHRSPELMVAARHEYSAALSATSAALRDRECARSDSTLAAVELLSMYEVVTCQGAPLIGQWLSHIEGGVKLIELRGFEQIQHQAGLELFTQIRLQIALGNLYKKERTPSWLLDLSKEALKHRGDSGDQVLDYFFRILVEVGDLVAAINESTFTHPVGILPKALNLDAELITWAMSIDPRWKYTVVEVEKPAGENGTFHAIYGDHYHIYPNIAVSMIWNTYRFIRIILHGIIAYVCAHHLPDSGKASNGQSERQSVAISQQLAEDICASVPYHLGMTGSSDGSPTLGIPFAGGVLRLMWPLFIASDCQGAPPKMRAWIAQCLDKIGRGVGINMAVTMSEILRADMHLSWLEEDETNLVKRRPYLVRNEYFTPEEPV